MERSAVEWLVEQLRMQTPLYTKEQIIEIALEMENEQKGFSDDDVNLAFMLGKKDDHVRLHKLIDSRLGQLKSE